MACKHWLKSFTSLFLVASTYEPKRRLYRRRVKCQLINVDGRWTIVKEHCPDSAMGVKY